MKRGGRRNFYDDRSCYWRCPFCLCLYFSDSDYNSCPDPMTPSTISSPSLAIPPESSVQKHGQPSDFSFASASGTNTFAKLSIVGLSTLTPFPNGAAAVTTTAAATIWIGQQWHHVFCQCCAADVGLYGFSWRFFVDLGRLTVVKHSRTRRRVKRRVAAIRHHWLSHLLFLQQCQWPSSSFSVSNEKPQNAMMNTYAGANTSSHTPSSPSS
jgi:hypothetical protein